jgi:predicted amidophosphoribosyltransferase
VLPVRAVYAVDAHFVAVLGASKYRGARSVGRRLCREAAARLQLPAEPGWLLAVPLTAAKLRSRGFNQPQDFVRALVARGGEEATPLLERCRGGPSSAGRARADRERTVAGAFRVGRAHVPPLPSRILLVDDVVTTGSTARACATVLREAGVSSVEVLALARAFESAADRAPASRDALERL